MSPLAVPDHEVLPHLSVQVRATVRHRCLAIHQRDTTTRDGDTVQLLAVRTDTGHDLVWLKDGRPDATVDGELVPASKWWWWA
jgi:hypothetical protein